MFIEWPAHLQDSHSVSWLQTETDILQEVLYSHVGQHWQLTESVPSSAVNKRLVRNGLKCAEMVHASLVRNTEGTCMVDIMSPYTSLTMSTAEVGPVMAVSANHGRGTAKVKSRV